MGRVSTSESGCSSTSTCVDVATTTGCIVVEDLASMKLAVSDITSVTVTIFLNSNCDGKSEAQFYMKADGACSNLLIYASDSDSKKESEYLTKTMKLASGHPIDQDPITSASQVGGLSSVQMSN